MTTTIASVAVFPPGFRVTDANGEIVSGATIQFYGAGTNTPKTVYSDNGLTVTIGTSMTTDASGYPASGGNKTLVYVGAAPYKVVILDAASNILVTHDNVLGAISGSVTTSTPTSTFGLHVGDVKLTLTASPDAGFVRLGETTQNLLKASYPDLNTWASNQGYPWGSTSTTFGIPPAAGYMIRAAATTNAIDPSGPRAPGSIQLDGIAAHNHPASSSSSSSSSSSVSGGTIGGTGSFTFGSGGSGPGITGPTGISVSTTTTTTTTTTVANQTGGLTETRSKNVAFNVDMLAVPAAVSTALIGASGFSYAFNSATTPTSLTAGQFCLDNTEISATHFYVSQTDGLGSPFAPVWAQVPSGSLVYISKVGTPSTFLSFVTTAVATNSGTYDSFPIGSVNTSVAQFANGDPVSILVMRSGTLGSPMTAVGDMVVGGTAGTPARLPAGSSGQVLSMVAGVPTWITPVVGGTLTTNGVTNAYLAQAPANTIKGNNTAFTANEADLTMAQLYAMLKSTPNPMEGFDAAINLQINASVASNALTVALKGNNGSDPSASNPVIVPFRDATVASGDPQFVVLNSALSVTVPSGQVVGTANGVPFRFWLVAINNGGTVALGLINCLVGAATPTAIAPLAEHTLISTTAIATAPSAGVFYSTAALTGKAFRILGYVEYGSGLAAAGTYATAPTIVQLFGPGIKRPGEVVQTATGSTSTQTSTTSATFVATTLTATLTPTSAANIVKAACNGSLTNTVGTSTGVQARMYRGTTAFGNLVGVFLGLSGGSILAPAALQGLDAPGVTTSTTWTLNIKSDGTNSAVWCTPTFVPAIMSVDELMA